jgi:hypothetical protein
LTTNPNTGLPEASFLEGLAPALIGAALDTFVPGAGSAIGGLFGLEGAAASSVGSGMLVGGATGLATGSLEKGLTAGLGAWGGANLAHGLGEMGGAANARAANAAFDASNPAFDEARVNAINAAAKPDILAGIMESAAHPMDYLKDNKWALGAAALPAFMSDQNSGIAALQNKGYIRRYAKNPKTGALEQVEAVPVDQWGDRSAVTFGGVGQPVKYASGGTTGTHLVYNSATKKYDTVDASGNPVGPVTFADMQKPVNMSDPNDTRSDSQKAYDYLMGVPGAKNPMLFYHEQPTTEEKQITPDDLNSRTGGHYVFNANTNKYDWIPDATVNPSAGGELDQNQKGRNENAISGGSGQGFTGSTTDGSASTGLASGVNSLAAYLGNFGFTNLSDALASQVNPNYGNEGRYSTIVGPDQSAAETARLDRQASNTTSAPATNPMSLDPAQIQAAQIAAAQTQATNPMSLDPAQRAAQTAGAATQSNESNSWGGESRGAVRGGDGLGGSSGISGISAGVGEAGRGDMGSDSGRGEGGGGRDAVGGFFHNGKFNYHPPKMYADGGIAALAQGGYNLGSYSDGGQLLRGPGDGVSDDIPATIGHGQPARLADGEFVIPARIVSELGNGSTEAGAKQLYKMMDRIQAGRAKTIGKNKVATNSKAARHLPA